MKILCPTDFSDHSLLALQYAVNLSKLLSADLHVISAYDVPKSTTSFISLDENIRKNAEIEMERLLSGIGLLVGGDTEIYSQVLRGYATDVILDYLIDQDIDVVVMGTKGSNSFRTFMYGSVTKAVIRKCKKPIFVIPDEYVEPVIQDHLLLAYDGKGYDNEEHLDLLFQLTGKLKLKINVLHVTEDLKQEKEFSFQDPDFLLNFQGQVEIEQSDHVLKSIQKFIEKEKVSLLIMIKRQKRFLERIFNISTTTAETGRIHIPLLILSE